MEKKMKRPIDGPLLGHTVQKAETGNFRDSDQSATPEGLYLLLGMLRNCSFRLSQLLLIFLFAMLVVGSLRLGGSAILLVFLRIAK